MFVIFSVFFKSDYLRSIVVGFILFDSILFLGMSVAPFIKGLDMKCCFDAMAEVSKLGYVMDANWLAACPIISFVFLTFLSILLEWAWAPFLTPSRANNRTE